VQCDVLRRWDDFNKPWVVVPDKPEPTADGEGGSNAGQPEETMDVKEVQDDVFRRWQEVCRQWDEQHFGKEPPAESSLIQTGEEMEQPQDADSSTSGDGLHDQTGHAEETEETQSEDCNAEQKVLESSPSQSMEEIRAMQEQVLQRWVMLQSSGRNAGPAAQQCASAGRT